MIGNPPRTVRKALLLLLLLAEWSSAGEILFSGNHHFSQRQLLQQISIPNDFDQLSHTRQEYFIELAKYQIKELCDNKGFFSATIQCFLIHREEDTYWNCELNVGPRWAFGEVRFSSENLELLQKRPPTQIRPGTPFQNEKLTEEVERFRDAFRDMGYLHLRTDFRLIPDTLNHIVDLDILLTPGVQVKMGELKIETKRIVTPTSPEGGEGLSSKEYIRELWSIPHEENVANQEYTLFRKKLLQTGLFRQVKLKDSLREDGLSDIHLLAVEKQPGVWSNRVFWEPLYLGGGVETQVRYRNFGGRFHEGNVGALVSENRQRLSLGYAHPLPFGKIFRFEDKFSYNQEELPILNYPDSLEQRFEFKNRATVSHYFTPNIRGVFSADVRRITLYAGQNAAPDSLERFAFNKLNLGPILDFQYTDDWLEPTRGWRGRTTLINGGRFDRRFNSIEVNCGLYLPLGSKVYWAVAGDWGHFFSAGDGDDAKVFYQGGFRSVRGYGERSIFPSYSTKEIDEDGDEIDVVHPGLTPQYVRVTNEFRVNLPMQLKNFQLVQFIDWARVSDADDIYQVGEAMGAGVGIRYRLPFLTIRLDYTLKRNFRDLLEMEPFALNRISFDLSQAI